MYLGTRRKACLDMALPRPRTSRGLSPSIKLPTGAYEFFLLVSHDIVYHVLQCVRNCKSFLTNRRSLIVQIDRVTMTVKKSFNRVYDDILNTYSDHKVLLWSFWHVVGTTGYLQVIIALIFFLFLSINTQNMVCTA